MTKSEAHEQMLVSTSELFVEVMKIFGRRIQDIVLAATANSTAEAEEALISEQAIQTIVVYALSKQMGINKIPAEPLKAIQIIADKVVEMVTAAVDLKVAGIKEDKNQAGEN